MNFDRFIGVPFTPKGSGFDGCDCWGLCRLVLREEFGVHVADLAVDYPDLEDFRVLEKSAMAEQSRPLIWTPVEHEDTAPGDVCLLRLAGYPIHCGIMIGGNRMLHIFDTIAAFHVDISPGKIWQRRIMGIYRHKELVNATATP